MARWTWLALAIAVAGPPATAAEECRFVYTPEFRARVVLPRLKAVARDRWADWDNPNPTVEIRDQRVKLEFANLRADAADGPRLVVWVDDCGKGRATAGLIPAALDVP
jgi:hypothetical protein